MKAVCMEQHHLMRRVKDWNLEWCKSTCTLSSKRCLLWWAAHLKMLTSLFIDIWAWGPMFTPTNSLELYDYVGSHPWWCAKDDQHALWFQSCAQTWSRSQWGLRAHDPSNMPGWRLQLEHRNCNCCSMESSFSGRQNNTLQHRWSCKARLLLVLIQLLKVSLGWPTTCVISCLMHCLCCLTFRHVWWWLAGSSPALAWSSWCSAEPLPSCRCSQRPNSWWAHPAPRCRSSGRKFLPVLSGWWDMLAPACNKYLATCWLNYLWVNWPFAWAA